MSVDRGVVRRAAQLVAISQGLAKDGLGENEDAPRPLSWPALTGPEARDEWDELRTWVGRLRVRFPHAVRLPECWWQHNDLVEVLAALRDFERACFAPSSPATAAVEWQRALRDMELRMEIWIKRFTCGVRGHDPPREAVDGVPPGWDEFVDQDVRRRERKADSPTPQPSN